MSVKDDDNGTQHYLYGTIKIKMYDKAFFGEIKGVPSLANEFGDILLCLYNLNDYYNEIINISSIDDYYRAKSTLFSNLYENYIINSTGQCPNPLSFYKR